MSDCKSATASGAFVMQTSDVVGLGHCGVEVRGCNRQLMPMVGLDHVASRRRGRRCRPGLSGERHAHVVLTQFGQLTVGTQKAGEVSVVGPAAREPRIAEYIGAALAQRHHLAICTFCFATLSICAAPSPLCQFAISVTQKGLPYLSKRSS